ncbi:MAG: hypothetical protein LBP63_06105 [Prevotellaceae bacterium]|jgi:PBP1b-binding outer membrane lipoprotein LpoB|nr:hypothetical protein [Prevotellaceae bacterium]
MKKHSIFYVILLFALLFTSCDKTATIQVTNNVHNVRLDNINFDKFGIGSHIITGESTQQVEISTQDNVSFPLSAQLQFYMVKGDTRVFLKTKEIYTLNEDAKLIIVINDDTEVVNISTD